MQYDAKLHARQRSTDSELYLLFPSIRRPAKAGGDDSVKWLRY